MRVGGVGYKPENGFKLEIELGKNISITKVLIMVMSAQFYRYTGDEGILLAEPAQGCSSVALPQLYGLVVLQSG